LFDTGCHGSKKDIGGVPSGVWSFFKVPKVKK